MGEDTDRHEEQASPDTGFASTASKFVRKSVYNSPISGYIYIVARTTKTKKKKIPYVVIICVTDYEIYHLVFTVTDLFLLQKSSVLDIKASIL